MQPPPVKDRFKPKFANRRTYIKVLHTIFLPIWPPIFRGELKLPRSGWFENESFYAYMSVSELTLTE